MTDRERAWGERFRALATRKAGAAAGARLWPYVTDRVEAAPGAIPVANAWSSRFFDGPFYLLPARLPRRPACSLIFVQSADVNTGANDPADLGGGATDQHLVYEGLSRVAADAVLAGAETVRDGDVFFSVWHPELIQLRTSLGLARHPVQMIATIRGLELDDHLVFNVPGTRVIVLTTRESAEGMARAVAVRPWVTVLEMENPANLVRAFERLPALGVSRISCVGGPTLAAALMTAGLIDDVHLTTSPRPGGRPGTPWHANPPKTRTIIRKHGTGEERGVLFEHLALEMVSGEW